MKQTQDQRKSKVYIQHDADGRITRCEGGYTTPANLDGWLYIDEGDGDRYNLCQSHYFEDGLYTMDGIPLYRWDGKVIPRTAGEIEADRAALPKPEPSPIGVLQSENKLLKERVGALSEQNDFQEELIVELASVIYA